MFSFNNIIIDILIIVVLVFQIGNVDAITSALRLRRTTPTLDVSLKTPVLNSLTERIQVDNSWERCMIVAPLTIQLLGQLLLVSTTKDVSLLDFTSDRALQFKHIRNPQSLRATLLQVSNEGYQAFLSGHSTMNVIQLRMIQIPKHIKTALKVLGGKLPSRVIKTLLPQLLNNIKETGDECVKLTNTTKNEYFKVMELIQEVKETVIASQSAHEFKVEEDQRELAVLRQQKERLEKEEQIRGQNYREAVAAANKAEQFYYDALKKIPTGWNALRNDLVRGLVRITERVVEVGAAFLTGNIGPRGGTMSRGYHASESSGNDDSEEPPSFSLKQTVETTNDFFNTLTSFKTALTNDNKDPTELNAFNIALKAHREFIASLSSNPAKSKVIRIIERAERLIKKATGNAKRTKPDDKIYQDATNELETIFSELETIRAVHQQINPRAASNTISNIQNKGNSPGDSSQNEVLLAQIAQNTLTELRRRQDAQTAEYLNLIDTLHKTSAKMMTIDLTTIHYKEIITMLNESFVLLSQVHEQWNDFVLFFARMAIHIENMVKGPLKRFLSVASVGSNEEYAARMELIFILKDETYSIHREAYILYVMARTYFEMSSKHFMSRLASLSSMLATRDESQRKLLMENLRSQTEQALKEIEAVIRERKENFDNELNSRYTELSELIEKLGGPNENNQLIMEEANNLIDEDKTWGDR